MNKTKVLSSLHPLLFRGICHRGLHNAEYTENGLKAFQNAIEHHMAFELDVHITKDYKVVVCHDSNLMRVTGKEGIIEELTFDELRSSYKLFDGGNIPTLQEVFDLTQEQVPIVVELKVYKSNYKALTKCVLEVLKSIQDKRNITIISFDPRALVLVKHKGFELQFLVTKNSEKMFNCAFLFGSVDLDQRMLQEDKYRAYAKHHITNVWTIETKEQLDAVLPYCDMVTFQHLDADEVKATLQNQ